MDEVYGRIFDNMFSLVDKKGKENLEIIKNEILKTMDVKGVDYSSSETWMLEMYEYDDVYGLKQSFYEYYLDQDTRKLTTLAEQLEGKTINVSVSNLNDGQNTHLLADIDIAITFFGYLVDAAPGWDSMDLWEGYRNRNEQEILYGEGYQINSKHKYNKAIDFGNVMVNGAIVSPDKLWAKASNSGLFRKGGLQQYGLHLEVEKEWGFGNKYSSISNGWSWFMYEGQNGEIKNYWQTKWQAGNVSMEHYFDGLELRDKYEDEFKNLILGGYDVDEAFADYLRMLYPYYRGLM